jgi:hypothetical protein
MEQNGEVIDFTIDLALIRRFAPTRRSFNSFYDEKGLLLMIG